MPTANDWMYEFLGMDPANDQPCSPLCDAEYCAGCAMKECPRGEPLHRHHDGCPACAEKEP